MVADADEPSEPGPEPDPAIALRQHAERLLDGIEAALPGWVERSVARIADAWQPGLADQLRDQAELAGRAASADVGPRLRALLSADVDDQATGPLDICRGAVRYPTEILAAAGVPPVQRDEFADRMFPDDLYDLTPGGFGEIHPDLAEPGLAWGAAKAYVVMARRRAEGKR